MALSCKHAGEHTSEHDRDWCHLRMRVQPLAIQKEGEYPRHWHILCVQDAQNLTKFVCLQESSVCLPQG